jgi:hypothetical protein
LTGAARKVWHSFRSFRSRGKTGCRTRHAPQRWLSPHGTWARAAQSHARVWWPQATSAGVAHAASGAALRWRGCGDGQGGGAGRRQACSAYCGWATGRKGAASAAPKVAAREVGGSENRGGLQQGGENTQRNGAATWGQAAVQGDIIKGAEAEVWWARRQLWHGARARIGRGTWWPLSLGCGSGGGASGRRADGSGWRQRLPRQARRGVGPRQGRAGLRVGWQAGQHLATLSGSQPGAGPRAAAAAWPLGCRRRRRRRSLVVLVV